MFRMDGWMDEWMPGLKRNHRTCCANVLVRGITSIIYGNGTARRPSRGKLYLPEKKSRELLTGRCCGERQSIGCVRWGGFLFPCPSRDLTDCFEIKLPHRSFHGNIKYLRQRTPKVDPIRRNQSIDQSFNQVCIMPQAWQVHQNIKNASRQSPGALANLELHDVPKPVPGPKAALIRIHAGLSATTAVKHPLPFL